MLFKNKLKVKKYTYRENMINDINLIATLPRLDDKYSIDEIMRCNEISSVRFNSGVDNLMTASEIVSKLKELSEFYHKKI